MTLDPITPLTPATGYRDRINSLSELTVVEQARGSCAEGPTIAASGALTFGTLTTSLDDVDWYDGDPPYELVSAGTQLRLLSAGEYEIYAVAHCTADGAEFSLDLGGFIFSELVETTSGDLNARWNHVFDAADNHVISMSATLTSGVARIKSVKIRRRGDLL